MNINGFLKNIGLTFCLTFLYSSLLFCTQSIYDLRRLWLYSPVLLILYPIILFVFTFIVIAYSSRQYERRQATGAISVFRRPILFSLIYIIPLAYLIGWVVEKLDNPEGLSQFFGLGGVVTYEILLIIYPTAIVLSLITTTIYFLVKNIPQLKYKIMISCLILAIFLIGIKLVLL